MQQSLAIAAMLALITASCDTQTNQSYRPVPDAAPSPSADKEVPAVFYETVADCEADVQKQTDEYDILETAFQNGELAEGPTKPALDVEDCEPQLQAAKEEHQKHAPVYGSLEDCEADGLKCEPVENAQNTGNNRTGYSPRFGGFFFFPYVGPSYTYVNYGGSQRQVYQPRTVYQGSTGQLVTPNGQVVGKTQSGRVQAPASTRTAAPPRPKGTAARGTVSGRGSRGFGSTFKGTGRGGK